MILLTDYEHMLMDLKKALAQTKSLKTGRLSALSVESSQLQVRVVSKFHVISVKWSGNLCLNKNHLSSSLLITRILHLHNGRTSFQGSNLKKKDYRFMQLALRIFHLLQFWIICTEHFLKIYLIWNNGNTYIWVFPDDVPLFRKWPLESQSGFWNCGSIQM